MMNQGDTATSDTAGNDYSQNVFINCPFDPAYQTNLLYALVFAVHDCGFRARCALEVNNSGTTRMERIFKIIEECRFGIHDISRTESDPKTNLPRFNMPMELGLFLGATKFGNDEQRQKSCIIMDTQKTRYRKFCSDLAGHDIEAHSGSPQKAIKIVYKLLRPHKRGIKIPDGTAISKRYERFCKELPELRKDAGLSSRNPIFHDMQELISAWQTINEW